jgi:hypothetical protein
MVPLCFVFFIMMVFGVTMEGDRIACKLTNINIHQVPNSLKQYTVDYNVSSYGRSFYNKYNMDFSSPDQAQNYINGIHDGNTYFCDYDDEQKMDLYIFLIRSKYQEYSSDFKFVFALQYGFVLIYSIILISYQYSVLIDVMGAQLDNSTYNLSKLKSFVFMTLLLFLPLIDMVISYGIFILICENIFTESSLATNRPFDPTYFEKMYADYQLINTAYLVCFSVPFLFGLYKLISFISNYPNFNNQNDRVYVNMTEPTNNKNEKFEFIDDPPDNILIDDSNCVICYEREYQLYMSDCKHIYCTACLQQWFGGMNPNNANSNKCVACTKVIKKFYKNNIV